MMREICEHIRSHRQEIMAAWEELVREEPWYSLPPEHRVNDLPEVLEGLAGAALCDPGDRAAHRRSVDAACAHGMSRRALGIPDHLMFTEYHLLRRAVWYHVTRRFGSSDATTKAIMRIDSAISVATNASMWGYNRAEIEALGKWEEGIDRIVDSSPLLHAASPSE